MHTHFRATLQSKAVALVACQTKRGALWHSASPARSTRPHAPAWCTLCIALHARSCMVVALAPFRCSLCESEVLWSAYSVSAVRGCSHLRCGCRRECDDRDGREHLLAHAELTWRDRSCEPPIRNPTPSAHAYSAIRLCRSNRAVQPARLMRTICGPEVVAPRRDAVRLVDGNQHEQSLAIELRRQWPPHATQFHCDVNSAIDAHARAMSSCGR